jgi:hypothetical protein
LNKEKFQKNSFLYSVENWKEEVKTMEIWEMHYREEDFDEDNDTSEEEDEVDDE